MEIRQFQPDLGLGGIIMRVTTPTIEVYTDTETITFDEETINKCNIHEEIDLISDKLVPKTCEFSIFILDDDWKILEPKLQKSQKIKVTVKLVDSIFGLDTTKTMGIFYIDSWNREMNNISTVKAVGFMAKLSEMNAAGSVLYVPPTSVGTHRTVAEWAESFFDVTDTDYVLDSNLADLYLVGTLPHSSRKDYLRYVAFSIGAVVEEDRDGVFQIYPIEKNVAYEVEEDRMIPPVKESKINPIRTLRIDNYSYLAKDSLLGTEEVVFKGHLNVGENIVYYEKPVCDHSQTLPSGVTVISERMWWSKYNVSTAGDYELKGWTYNELINPANYQDPTSTNESSISIGGNRLITSYNSETLSQSLFDFYNFFTNTLEFKYISNGEEVGFFGSFQVDRKRYALGTIVSQDIDVSGGLIVSAKALISEFKDVFNNYTGQSYYTGESIGLI